MEQIVQQLVTQGGFGLVAGIFFWLYKTERDEHKKTQAKYESALEARRTDAKESFDKVVDPLEKIAQSQEFIAGKLVISKRGRG